ncbi:unnamed protein product [Lepeophtheirus salmonis]|uniref:(salmon louse) hypothetical protein n=1 Tax=Lepeophtheirus salmonis TaxID=72036 RepID=A0A7R8CY58_LEPSM|nr:unnamed protein product [Lepeophtheirus salmonis]CAF2938827.1 unnamed protein product [Lepeophtheirus salmonis]
MLVGTLIFSVFVIIVINVSKIHEFKSPETNTLLIINWFRHPALDGLDDSNLEYTDEDIQAEFKVFYDDIAPEIEPRSRRIVVAGNRAQYLRGNVYVEFDSENSCIERFRALHGRWV